MKGKYGMKNKISKIQNNFAILVRTALYFILMNNKVRGDGTPLAFRSFSNIYPFLLKFLTKGVFL